MSGKLDRDASPKVTLPKTSFAKDFVAAGFRLPDQKLMRRRMTAATHGLDPDANKREIFFAALRGKPKSWTVFPDWESFLEYGRTAEREPTGDYGRPAPQAVVEHVKAVRARFPHATVKVYAFADDDPWIGFTFDGEEIITIGWKLNGGERIYR